MDLQLATVGDIVNELANRGLQFVIAIEVVNNNEPKTVHLCVDSKKDQMAIAQAVAPFFDLGQGVV
jgi:hypothetical protein